MSVNNVLLRKGYCLNFRIFSNATYIDLCFFFFVLFFVLFLEVDMINVFLFCNQFHVEVVQYV